ncbi:MAG TPA: methyltransferase, TIGR04325 family [Pseudolabrys sp.]|nr:methyltransferase, TIGR04325 family [Pseudolabrys sp.]
MSITTRLAAIAPLNRFVSRAIERLPYSLRTMLLSAIREGIVRRPPFQGVYARFEDAAASYPSAASAEAFAKAGLSLKREEAAGLVILRRSHALLAVAVGMLAKRTQPLRILDFGGSGGIDYQLVKETTGAALRYQIVEVPATCEAGRKLWPDDPQITFAETLPSEGEFDIVYAWSAIHYVPDPLDLLVRFTRYRPQIILIVHSPFAPRAFVRAQVQGTVCLPHWVISLPEAERVMQENGYRLAMRATDDFAYNVDNYDPEHQVPHMANLLFVRD